MQARVVTIVSVAAMAALLSVVLVAKSTANRTPPPAFEDGVVHVKLDYAMPEAIDRMRADIAGKGIMLFSTIDQSKLASELTAEQVRILSNLVAVRVIDHQSGKRF